MDEVKKNNDILFQALNEYEKILNNKYKYILENGASLEIIFKKSFFPHLIGLHKLKDRDNFNKLNSEEGQATRIYREIKKGKITIEDIKKSSYFLEIKERIETFLQIEEILAFSEVLINFKKEILKKQTKMDTELKSNIIFYKKIKDMYIHLCIVKQNGKVYPESFFTRKDANYIKGQAKRLILEKEIITNTAEKKKGKSRKKYIK